MKNENICSLLAVGGGSVIDGTKFIEAASNFDGDSREILKGGYAPLPARGMIAMSETGDFTVDISPKILERG